MNIVLLFIFLAHEYRHVTTEEWRDENGTKWANLTPQSLRRGFGQAVWEKTDNALLTASMMRHSLAMTEKEYVQVDRGIKKRAHELVFKPIGSKTSSKRKSK